MKPPFSSWSILLPVFLVLGLSSASWARFHGRFGVVIGPGFWYPGPYYDSYYDYPYEPYVYVPYTREATPEERAPKPDESRHDLTFIEGQLARAREQINYDFEDGDITKEQRKMAHRHLAQIRDKAYAETKANGGFITGQQEKELLNELRGNPTPTYSE